MRTRFSLLVLLLSACATIAVAADPPKRKSGLWEITISHAQGKGEHKIEQCVDEKSDELMKSEMHGAAKPDCSKRDVRRDGNTVTSDSVCKIGGSTATTHAVFTGKYDSAYHADIKSSYDPPMHGIRESATSIDAKWLGSCKPGQKA